MEMLSELRHDRIANLRAVVIQPQLRAMIFEYTDLGDLKNYPLARNPNSDMPSHAGPLTLEQQIDICHQVKLSQITCTTCKLKLRTVKSVFCHFITLKRLKLWFLNVHTAQLKCTCSLYV